jgi:4-hydroxy-tetrahydrodipicolinate synthase
MKQPIFTGSGVAIITPFTEKGIDFDKMGELLEWHIQEKTDAIIVCGTTGEAPTMSTEEQRALIEFCVKKVDKRIPVIAGAGSNDTKNSIAATQFAKDAGADAVLSVVPYYNRPTQKGVYTHFSTIANTVDIPIILYNIPGRTGTDMLPSTVSKLAQLDNIVGIKECNFNHVAELKKTCPDDFAIYSGEDGNVVPLLSLGGIGVISVMANIIPRDTHEMVSSYLEGKVKKSLDLQLKTLDLIHALFIESNPVPTKTAMNLLNMNVGKCRLPLTEMELPNIEVLKHAMKEYGLL